MKFKELKHDQKKSVLRREKDDCVFWAWYGVEGCMIHKVKICRWCAHYTEKKDD